MNCNCSSICRNGVYESKTLIKIQQGDTFPLYIYYYGGNDETPSPLPSGLYLMACLYDYKGELVSKYSTKDRSIRIGFGYYKIDVSHEDSMKIVGSATLELTIVYDGNNVVDHASDIITILAEPRKNNNEL